MSKNLIIVESPAKAKTIQKFIGKDYTVISSKGHVRDLPSKGMGIDIAHDFEPQYEVLDDKKTLINDIKKKAAEADTIWLATDDDREGEAISWHLMEVTKMDPEKVKRIVFHEITKSAIEEALSNPRTLNVDLVNAQQARRVLDRLVGFELSPVLWRKVRPSLSAGRVQSVAVKLIVEREHEIEKFNSTSSYKVDGLFTPLRDAKVEFDLGNGSWKDGAAPYSVVKENETLPLPAKTQMIPPYGFQFDEWHDKNDSRVTGNSYYGSSFSIVTGLADTSDPDATNTILITAVYAPWTRVSKRLSFIVSEDTSENPQILLTIPGDEEKVTYRVVAQQQSGKWTTAVFDRDGNPVGEAVQDY